MKKVICFLLAVVSLWMLAACEKDGQENAKFAPFTIGTVTVSVGAEAAPVIEALGAYESFAETDSCYGDGTDKVYQYTSYKIQPYSNAGVDYILSVELFSDSDESVKTVEGIRVGDSRDAAVALYGTPDTENTSQLVYENKTNGTKLQFLLRDGQVSYIQYLK